MSNAIPVGHYSQLGEQTINRIANDDIEFMNFMKYFGRVFKHPVSVALEFYANRPEAQFIASATQWKTAGFQLKPASKGIQFLDNSGKAITLYDFDDVIGEYPPKRWTITNKNVDAVREKLELPKNEPFFAALDTSSASAIDDLSLIQELELNSLTNEEKLKFRNSYHGMIQTMIAGRLEINGARYSVQPDRAALQFCKTSEQRLLLLSSAASAARKALNSVEYAFDTIRTEIAQRKDEVKNDVRTVESTQRGTENASTGNRLSSDSERGTGERSDRVQTGEEGQSARMDDSSEGRRTDQSDVAAGSNDRNDNIGERDDRAAVPSESLRRTVRSDDPERTVDGGTADRTVRSDVDGKHGEELPREGRNDDVPSQLSDGSTVGSGESSSVQGAADGTVRQTESSSAHDGLQHTSRMDNSEEVSDRPLGNDGDSSSSSDNSLNTEHLNDLIFRVSHFYSVNNAVLNSDKETAIFEIKTCCQKMLPYMLDENLDNDTFAEFYNAISAKFASDTAYFDSLAEQIYTDVASKITENDRISANWKNVDVITDNGNDGIDWVYYNPDSSEGGQLVVNHLTHEQLLDSTRFEDNYNYLQSVARQELIDISAVDFADTANYYLNLANNTDALFVCRTGNMKEIQLFLNDYIKKLENPTTDNYTEYRNNLKESRFTALSNAQKFKYAHTPYVEEPESSIWGEVDHVYRINNGIFEVATPSHGGIMIESNIARAILSPEAQNVAQKERGWYYFEEDCDYAVAKRELLDKGLFSDIDDYFSSQYSQKTNDFFTSYSNSINDSIQHWNDTYWNSREAALSNTSASDVSSIIDDIKVDLEETREIRQREIRKAMDDAQRRIDRIKEASGDPNDLAAQENVLNFLKAASEENIELTTENFNAFVAEHGVATNSNDGSNSYFEIYQLKNNAELRYHRFTDYEALKREGNAVEAKNYTQVYRDVLESGTKLDDIYYRFNMEHPDDFKGHSLSVSDIIVVHDNGDTAAYYVDSFGFKKVPEFLQLEQENNIVQDFRERTTELFKPIDRFNSADIENLVKDYVELTLSENEVNATVGRAVLYGSRSRGLENPDSDIDIVIEIDSEMREDALFNLLHETEREIGGFKVDINPIRKEETGTLETYLPNAEKYLIDKASNVDASDNEQAIHNAFAAVYAKHNYSAKQKQFLERLEKFAAKNNVTENIVDTAFEKSVAFHNTYGNKEYVSRNLFALRLGSLEKELESEIKLALGTAQSEIADTDEYETPLDEAKHLINRFCETEYGDSADFSDLHRVSIAYTDEEETGLPIQAYADLIDNQIIYTYDGEIYDTEQYSSLEDMNKNALEHLRFDALVIVPDEVIEKHSPEVLENPEKYEKEQAAISEISALTDELNAQILHDVEVGDVLYMKEPQSGELMYFRVDSFTNNFMVNFSRVADAGGNSYDEIGFSSFGIIDGHWRETILDANTDSPILRFTKQYQEDYRKQQSEAHESAILQPITINKYGLNIDFKKISSIELQEHQYIYEGGIDENGHERKDNFSEEFNTISFYDIDDSNSIMRWDSSSEFGGEPVSLKDAAAEIEAFLDKAINDGNLAAFIKNTDGSRTYLNAEKLLVPSAINEENNLIDTVNSDDVATNSNDESIDILPIGEEATVETAASETVQPSINAAPLPTGKPHRATRAEMLYREFVEAFPDIANGNHTHERYGAEYIEDGDNDAYEPLSLESLGDDTYSFMMWYVQNGDLMRDPDFVFTLDHESKELHVWEYQQDGVPFFGTVYESVTHEDGTVDRKLQASLEENFRNVLRNAVSVNRELSAYTDSNGEHELHEETSETAAPETYAEPEITDSSAQYREVLNEFSEKHNLGELNLLPNSNGYHITEKYNDGISVPLYYIYSYSYKPLTPEELQKELNNWEETASRNNSTVEKDSHREPQIHGGKTELPPIPDNLPEIKYADNPRRKVDDNLTAINEMQKLESYESEGNFYPFEQGRNDYNSYDSSMARLRRYSGWGGVPQFFDERYEGFNYQRARLKELITEEEYASARSSTLNSHYTPQIIIDEMVKTIRNMGLPKDARILEPSCGTGNFISRIPRDMGKGGIIGIELDPVTAKIAKHLVVPKHNPYAKKEQAALEDTRDIKIMNCGFENSNLPNNSFDLVIGNVPFGEYKMHDPEYSKDLLIHDAFFRKALDKVAPGGVVAFITSSGTLDKKNPKIREQLAMKADLIGAVRLPNNAFSDAGTSVTSDVIFLQKRKTPLNAYDPKPDWCYTTPVDVEMVGKKYEGETRTAHINSYFVQNPQMVLGTMKQTTHFDMLTCEPLEGKSLKEQLDAAFRQLNAKISIEKRENDIAEKKGHIQPWGKAFTFQIKDDKVYYNRGTTMDECKDNEKNINKLKALCDLRDITRELLDKQQTHISDEELVPLRNKLNEAYDKFVKDNGNLTSRSIYNLFSDDSDYPILGALEDIDPETKKVTKAAIFTTRTVKPVVEVTSVATADEALQVSLDKRGKVDIPYMATLVENQFEDKQLNEIMEIVASELLNKGAVFRDPEKLAAGKPYSEIVDRAEYLCGDVRRKLAIAQDMANQDSNYAANVDALTEIIPEDIGAAEISADIGCAWIDTDDYEDFVRELSERSVYDSRKYAIHYSDLTGKFTVENARQTTKADYNQNETSTYGTEDMNLYLIMDNLLNQRKVQVFDRIPDPNNPKKYKSVLNKNKTQVAQSKAKLIKQKFSEWIFADESRKEKYVRRYNDRFNSIVGRTYDGSHLTFSGMANGFKLRPHQADCVARTIYGGNTLAAHCVGAGKSAVIAASVMKKKELGLINKACIVVPKPLTEQTEREWRASFPDAKLLVVDNKDLSIEKKRDIFAARASTGDYDAIIMSQEQFEKLPMSPEHQLEFLERRKAELLEHLEAKKLESRGRRDYSVKEIEALLKSLEVKIEAILNPTSKQKGKDTLLNFEALGFDYLVVDEAHAYKNGSVLTKMGDVSGVSTRESGRSADMQMKCDYFNSEFGNGHILFATGTPVSNSMTELYVMTRYMRPDLLENCGCSRFDDWAATFGNIKTQNKKTATGELKLKTCFAGFKNRPELIKMYKEFADLKTLDKLDYLHPPKIKGGKPQVVEVEATPEQREMVKGFAERGRAIQAGLVTPSEDNLLKITSEARIVGLGNRAVASIYRKNDWDLPDNFVEDDKTGKIDECVKRVAEIYKERYDEKAVQLIFSDIAVNSGDDKFSAYEYLREELIAKGVKPEEIIFAPKSDAKNRPEIFRDINEGKYRVVIASTGTLGTGANIQKNLYALHHLDIPWRPSDFEQREGRIVRQGNKNEEVEIFNYVTKGTLDSYLYQGVTDKARGIAQLWNDTCVSRTAEDIDEKVLTFGELEAAAEGNPKLRQYSELKNKIDEMQVVRAEYNRETTRVEKKIASLPETISARKSLIEAAKNDKETAKRIQSISIITDKGETISEKDKVNKFIFDKVQLRITSPLDNNPSFKIGDFEVSVATASDRMHPTIKIQGERSAAYYFEAGVGGNADNYQRLANFFASGIDKQIEKDTASMQKAETDLEQAKHRVSQPFPNEEEYQTTLKEFENLETELTKGGFLDNGEEIAGAEDYGEVETEHLENNNKDKDDLTPEEYNHSI